MARLPLALAALLVLSLLPATAAPVQAVVQATVGTAPTAVLAGGHGSLTLALSNVGTASASNILASMTGADAPLQFSPGGSLFLGGLGVGQSTTVAPFSFAVNASAEPGFYHASLSLQYNYFDGTTTQWAASTATVTVQVRSPASLIVDSVVPHDVQPGIPTAVNITLRNEGSSTLSNIDGSWSAPGQAVLPLGGSNEFQVPSLGPFATLRVPLVLQAGAGAAGLVPLTFKLTYTDITGSRLTGNSTVGVVADAPALEVHAQRWAADSLVLAVSNPGVSPAGAVIVHIVPGGPVDVAGSADVLLGVLAAGSFGLATFSPAAPTASATAPLTVQVTFTDASGERHTQVVQLSLGGVPRVASLQVSLDEWTPDTLTVAVENVGVSVAGSVGVRILPGGPVTVRDSVAALLGNLNPGDFTTATFSPAAPTNRSDPLQVELSFTDPSGGRHTTVQSMPLGSPPAAAAPKAGIGLATWGLLLLVGGAAVAGVMVYRRRKKKA
ncbi:MAG: COG1361 S-layer family protein [Thermoplasmatota archaeon]